MRHDTIFTAALLVLSLHGEAHAYLDPGTGSMLLSVVIGLVSTAYFALRRLPAALRSLVFRMRGKKELLRRNHVVMYAESANYWNTFRPLLEEFGRRGTEVLYLTSDERDPVFGAGLPGCIVPRFIGTGNAAFTALGFLEADVLVLTTPGVDVLQIRRSRGVRRYVHVLHAPTDIHIYKIFSFDFYDAVLCNGPHQVDSLRCLEAKRHTRPKELPIVGCPYYDVLAARYEAEHADGRTVGPNAVLLAPTWGRNGMLTRTGSAIPRLLAEAGFDVTIRPHPQSYVSERDRMEALERELSVYPNVRWDRSPDGFPSLAGAAVMVSDMSGVICDYAFVFLRPVVTLGFEFDPDGFEAFDLPHEPWIFTVLDQIGRRLPVGDVPTLPEVIRTLRADEDLPRRLVALRERWIANFGHAAGPICDEILRIGQGTGKE